MNMEGDPNNQSPLLKWLTPELLLRVIYFVVRTVDCVQVRGLNGRHDLGANGVYRRNSNGVYHHINTGSGFTLRRTTVALFPVTPAGGVAYSLTRHYGTANARDVITFVESKEGDASTARRTNPSHCERACFRRPDGTWILVDGVSCENGPDEATQGPMKVGEAALDAVPEDLRIAERPFRVLTFMLLKGVCLALDKFVDEFSNHHCCAVHCRRPDREIKELHALWVCALGVPVCNECVIDECAKCHVPISEGCEYGECGHVECGVPLCVRCSGKCCWPTCRQCVCSMHSKPCGVPGCGNVCCDWEMNNELYCRWQYGRAAQCAACTAFICPGCLAPGKFGAVVCESPVCRGRGIFCSHECRGGWGGLNCVLCTYECNGCDRVVAEASTVVCAGSEHYDCDRTLCSECHVTCGHDECDKRFCRPRGVATVAEHSACGDACEACQVVMCEDHLERCDQCGRMVCNRAGSGCFAGATTEVMEDGLKIRTAVCQECLPVRSAQ